MIHILRQIIISVTVASIFSAMILTFVKDSALRQTVKLAAGMMMILALFTPFSSYKPVRTQNTLPIRREIETVTAQAQEKNMRLTTSSISGVIEQYIQSRALQLGVSCKASVTVGIGQDNTLSVAHIQVVYREDDDKKLKKLSEMIEQECGVSADKQSFEKQDGGKHL